MDILATSFRQGKPVNTIIELPNRQNARLRARGWTTRAETEFLNSLCPVEDPAFPDLGVDKDQAREAFQKGFNAVRDHSDEFLLRIPDTLTKNEQKVWLAIRSRTLKFGKLFEKIPQNQFLAGIRDERGELKRDAKGFLLFFPTGIGDRRNLDRAIKGLIAKRHITRIRAEYHPQFGQSYVFAPLPMGPMMDDFLQFSGEAFIASGSCKAQEHWRLLLEQINVRCKPLFDETFYGSIFERPELAA